jgi:N-acetylneuraminate synthase
MKTVSIDDRRIGAGFPVFVIAEVGVNHNGDLDMARRLVEIAAGCGADAVKFQTFKAERLASPEAAKAAYQRSEGDGENSQVEMLRRLELNEAAHGILKDYCRAQNVIFLSTPFDEESADLLERISVPAFKVSSGDLTNLPFLRHLARKGRPMIVSTGMANLSEVEAAVEAIEDTGAPPLALLHCVSAYPADPRDANLRAMALLREAFDRPVGWSDHTRDSAVAWAAVALGAAIVEKHVTLDCSLPGPDHKASLEPDDFRAFVAGIRTVEQALGDGRKRPRPAEQEIADVARRSLVALVDVAAGELLSEAMVGQRRPGTGLPPSLRPFVVGRRTRRPIPAGSVIALEMLE